MHFKRVHLKDFRNIRMESVALGEGFHFFCGKNGQGKTNFLEALGLVTALRSFRAPENKVLLRHGEKEAQIRYEIGHEQEGDVELFLKIGEEGKSAYLNGEKINRFGDLMGRFPTVVLSSEDLQLLRGSPGLRRRFIDLTLAAMDAEYFDILKRYHVMLQERNAILRREKISRGELAAYDALIIPEAYRLHQKRIVGLQQVGEAFKRCYQHIDGTQEEEISAEIVYKPDCVLKGERDFEKVLNQGADRDRLLKSTQRGPHRDDFMFKLSSRGARHYASEGQQRALVIALRLAQVAYFKEKSGLLPVVLVDDVLGQLDPRKTEGFWKALDPRMQVIATGTTLPMGNIERGWQICEVKDGCFKEDVTEVQYI